MTASHLTSPAPMHARSHRWAHAHQWTECTAKNIPHQSPEKRTKIVSLFVSVVEWSFCCPKAVGPGHGRHCDTQRSIVTKKIPTLSGVYLDHCAFVYKHWPAFSGYFTTVLFFSWFQSPSKASGEVCPPTLSIVVLSVILNYLSMFLFYPDEHSALLLLLSLLLMLPASL